MNSFILILTLLWSSSALAFCLGKNSNKHKCPSLKKVDQRFSYLDKKKWLPSCCFKDREDPTCIQKAQSFIEKMKQLNSPYTTKAKNKNALDGNGKSFWSALCEENTPDLTVDSKKRDKITVHDLMFAEKYHESNSSESFNSFKAKLLAALGSLFDQYDSQVALDQDKAKALYAQYVHFIHNGWSDIGYHFVLGEKTNTIFEGRNVAHRGAHVSRNNPGNIGIVLAGNKHRSTQGKLEKVQTENLDYLIHKISDEYKIDSKSIFTHHELDNRRICGVGIIHNHLEKHFRKSN